VTGASCQRRGADRQSWPSTSRTRTSRAPCGRVCGTLHGRALVAAVEGDLDGSAQWVGE
jgi:hypothetical protein